MSDKSTALREAQEKLNEAHDCAGRANSLCYEARCCLLEAGFEDLAEEAADAESTLYSGVDAIENAYGGIDRELSK